MGVYGNAIGWFNMPKTFLLVDENGRECLALVVGEEVVLTATAADIRSGKTAGTSEGLVVGTHECE